MESPIAPGKLLARSVCRHLSRAHGFQSLEEFVPAAGLRVDVMALGPKGEIWIIECKSSRSDYMSDYKWQGYLDYCDRFFWAVDDLFPRGLLPPDSGLILADQHDAEIVRMGTGIKLSAPRRRRLLIKFARTAAERHNNLIETAARDRFRSRIVKE